MQSPMARARVGERTHPTPVRLHGFFEKENLIMFGNDGLLKWISPKTEQAKPRRVEVRVG